MEVQDRRPLVRRGGDLFLRLKLNLASIKAGNREETNAGEEEEEWGYDGRMKGVG